MIPILYHESETIFSHNGIGQLYETIDYTVIEERNGSFTLELEYPADGRWATEIKDHRLISAKPNDLDEPHTFRINEIVKDVETQTILVFADTITNDLSGNMIIDVTVVDKNAQQALDDIKAGAMDPITYNLLSDIQTLSSSRWTNLNPLSCLSGTEGSIVSNWGGEIKRTNNAIHIYGRRGINNSARIYPGHGLDGFKMTVSTKGLVTHILPYVMYTRENQTEPTMVRGFVVASPLASNYPIKSIIAVDFSGYDEIFPEDELSETLYKNAVKTRLDGKAAGYFTYMNPDIDKPKVTVDVNLASLSDSSEYEQFKTLEHIGLTDTVDIWVEDYNIDVNLKIHTVEYSGLTEMVKSFKAGSVKHGIYSDVNATYEDKIDKIKEYIGTVENGIYNTIRETADGQNNIFSGYTTPDPTAVKDGDLWYKPLGSGEVEMYRWTDGVWNLAVTNADKIVIGSIDANLVNLVNLNANNISTGTIQGANGAWNLNTGVLYLGSSLEDAKLLWDGTNLTIKVASGQTVEEYVANTIISTEIQYRLSTSRTTLDGGTWSDIAPPPENGKYLWSRTKIIKKSGDVSYEPGPSGTCISGADGYTPIKGTDYFDGNPGTNGSNGTSKYLWIRYSQNANGDPMVTSPTGAVYIGIAVTETNVAPTLYSSYSWSLIKGTDGIKGEPGVNGQTSYLHIKYSDNGTTFTENNGEIVGAWIGTYTDFIEDDSSTFGAYTWNKVKGETGANGYTPIKGTDYFDGQPGTNGVSSYIWIRYSVNANGSPMVPSPIGALYIGVATTTTPTAPTAYGAYSWSLIKGTDGIKGETGVDGKSSYLHIKYSDNGTTFTSNSGETVGAWIGTYVDFIEADSTTFSKYTWNKVKGTDGINGYTPIKGTDYFDGVNGTNGINGSSSYLWVRYSANANGNPMVTSPTGAVYIGIATTTTNVAPTLYGSYSWSLIKGTDGNNGVKGEPGANGKSSYLHIKYSDNGTTFTANGGETVGKYIGTYVDFIEADSTTFSKYTWNKVRGEDGVDGQPGANGVSTYTWVKYADTSTGTGMTNTPDGKLYMGIAHNKPTATESSTASDYTWSLIKGTNGLPGANGVSTYTWIKYADYINGDGMSDSPDGKRFLGIAHNKTTPTESTTASLYTWTPLYDNVKVGGRNYLRKSNIPITSSTYNIGEWKLTEPIEQGTIMVISIKGELAPTKTSFGVYNSGGTLRIANLTSADRDANGVYKISFPWSIGSDGNTSISVYTLTNTQPGVSTIEWIKLEKGSIGTDYSQPPEEMYTGITKIDEDGVNVSRSNTEINTQLAYNGLTIFDGDAMIGAFGESGARIPNLDVDTITSVDVVQPVIGGEYYVRSGAYSSIQDCVDAIFKDGKKYLSSPVTINVSINTSGDVSIKGLVGSKLTIRFTDGVTLYGRIYLEGCSNNITIYTLNGRSTIKGVYFGVKIAFCAMVQLGWMNVYGDTIGVHAADNSKLYMIESDTGTSYHSCIAEQGTIVNTFSCRGSGYVAFEGRTGAAFLTHNSIPNGIERGLILSEGKSKAASTFQIPPVTSKTFVRTFTAATFDTLHNGGSVDSYYGATAAQNRWTGMSGWKQARIRMGAEIQQFMEGGSSIQVQIRLRRKNSSHGNNSAVVPTPAHGMSGAARGAWTGWGVISASNFGSSVDLRFGSDTYSNYAIWDAIEVWVSVVKSV